MPVWLTIILALGGSAIITYVVTQVCIGIHHRTQKYKDFVRNEKMDEVKNAMAEVINPRLDSLEDTVEKIAAGNQASLLRNLREDYNWWSRKGYCPLEIKQDYEKMYRAYHDLGKNGVMDTCYSEIMHLPTETRNQQE